MIIFQAESGQQIIARSNISLSELQKEVEDIVPLEAQIWLTAAGIQYKGDPDIDHLFLFNRLLLDPDNDFPSTNLTIDIEAPVPSSTIIDVPRGTEELELYLNAFASHVSYGKVSLQSLTAAITEYCGKACGDLQQLVQAKALGIAIQNLDSHSRPTRDTFQLFHTHALKEFGKHATLLQSFPADLKTLNRIPIHPSIAKDAKLDDYVPKDKLHAWVNRCQSSHGILEITLDNLTLQTSQLQDLMQEIQRGGDVEMLSKTGIEYQIFPKLQLLLDSTSDAIEKIQHFQQNFERDAARVDMKMENKDTDNSAKIQAIQMLYHIHSTEYLPGITKIDRYVRETVIYFSDSKVHLSQILVSKLQQISHIQSMIGQAGPSIISLTNALNIQSEALLQLLHVHRMAPAWGATLVEIVRRKEYVRVFLEKAKEVADILHQFRALEHRRRETYKNEIYRYIPVGLINGLDDPPPHCEISISNTKNRLPDVLIADISEFEKLVMAMKASQIVDSISKLQATMLKMGPQVENITSEFEKIVARSSFYERGKAMEEENKKLKVQTPSVRGASSHDTIKAYETRIKSLEKVLQDQYHLSQLEVTNPIASNELLERIQRHLSTCLKLTNQEELSMEDMMTQVEELLSEEKLMQRVEELEISLRDSESETQARQAITDQILSNHKEEVVDLLAKVSRLEAEKAVLLTQLQATEEQRDRLQNLNVNAAASLEEWVLVSKACIHTFSLLYQDWSFLYELLDLPPLDKYSVQDIIQSNDAEGLADIIKARIVKMSETSSVDLKNKISKLQEDPRHRVSFQKFGIQSLCLFLPTKNPQAWGAFHVETPHYFLSLDSHTVFAARIKKREWILASITKIDRCVVEDGSQNTFGLALGTTYYLCEAIPYIQ